MLAAVYGLLCLLTGATAGRGHERCSINTWLQSVMYHWVAVPVLKARWAVIGQFSFSAISVLKYLSIVVLLFLPILAKVTVNLNSTVQLCLLSPQNMELI